MKSSGWVKNALRLSQAVFLIGLAVWFGLSLNAFLPVSRFNYDLSYIGQGEALRHGAHSANELPSWRMPLGPLLESSAIIHSSPGAAKSALALVLIALLGLVVSLGASLGPLWCGLLAATVWQYMLWDWPLGPGFNKQLFFTPFVLAPAGILIWRARSPSLGLSLLLGLSIGAGLLYRSTLVFFPPLLAVYEFFFVHQRRVQIATRHAALICLVPLLFLVPWLRLNKIVHGEWTLFERGAANMNIVTGALGTVTGAHGDIRALMDPPPEDGMRPVLGWALREIVRQPGRYLRGVRDRVIYAFMLEPWLFGLAAAAVLGSWRRPEFRVLGLYSLYWLGITVTMSIENNYFEPLWPLLAALASAIFVPLLPPESRQSRPKLALALLLPPAAVCLVLGSWAASVSWSYAAMVLRHPAQSDQALENALAAHPGDAWLLQERGRRRSGRGEYAAARTDLSEALKRLPELSGLKLEYAWAWAQAGRTRPLINGRFTLYPRTDFFNEDLRDRVPIYRALAHWRQGRGELAAREMESGMENFCAHQGFLHLDILSGAEKAFDSRLRERCESNFLGKIENTLWYQKSLAAKITLAKDYLLRGGSRASPALILSLPYDSIEKLHASMPPKPKIIVESPPNAGERLKAQGIADFIAGEPEKSVAALLAAMTQNPTDLETAMSLAAVYTAHGCRREAIAVYDKTLASGRGDPSLTRLIKKSRGELAALKEPASGCRLQRPF